MQHTAIAQEQTSSQSVQRCPHSPHTLLASSSLSTLLYWHCLWLLLCVHLQARLRADIEHNLSSILTGRLCCHALPLPHPCSSSSLHTNTAGTGLFFLLPVSALTLPQTSSSPSSVLRTSGGSEGRTSSPHSLSFTNRDTRLNPTTKALLALSGGVISCIL